MAKTASKSDRQTPGGGRPGGPAAATERRRQGVATQAPAGHPQGEPGPETHSELSLLMTELERLKSELRAAKARVSELENRADEDALLPVLNRRGFDRELERTLAYVQRHGTDVSLVYIDLDDFKTINDIHGHAAGDAALRHVCDILLANVRRSDVVGRLGGDEFAVLLHRADGDAARAKADQLARALTSSGLVFEGTEIPMSLTAGTTRLRGSDTAAGALRRADTLMYEGKSRRRFGRDA